MSQESSNYYSIIPMEVLLDKNLSDKAKLIYAELSSLDSKAGFAWCSNRYLAELFGVSIPTVSRGLKELVDNNYIKCEYETDNARKIYLKKVLSKMIRPIIKNDKTSNHTRQDPLIKNDNKESIDEKVKKESIVKNNICATSKAEVAPILTKYKFPCKPSKNNKKTEWILSKEDLDWYIQTYPNIDIDLELKKMWRWLKENNLKTYGGMGKFISGWFARCNDRQPSVKQKESAQQRDDRNLKELEKMGEKMLKEWNDDSSRHNYINKTDKNAITDHSDTGT